MYHPQYLNINLGDIKCIVSEGGAFKRNRTFRILKGQIKNKVNYFLKISKKYWCKKS